MAREFAAALLEGRRPSIDVYRMTDYTLPGIIASESAELGGVPLSIPNLHEGPFAGTRLWDAVGLPQDEPAAEPYR